MLEISEALLAAQEYKFRDPYIELVFHNADGSGQLELSDRRMGIEHHRLLFGGKATILLNNWDNSIGDMTGWWVTIFYGDELAPSGGTGVEGEYTPILWVKSQMSRSKPGVKQVILQLQDVWGVLADKLAIVDEEVYEPYHFWEATAFSPYNMLAFLLNEADVSLESIAEGQDDGMMEALYLQSFRLNKPIEKADGTYETFKDAVLRALEYTKSYLRPSLQLTTENRGRLEVVYPQADDPVVVTYYSYKPSYFKEFVYRKNLVIPNRVLTYCDYDYDAGIAGEFREPLLKGEAINQPSINSYGHTATKIKWFPNVNDQWEATELAKSALEKAQIEAKGGRLIINKDHRVQILDLVRVCDAR